MITTMPRVLLVQPASRAPAEDAVRRAGAELSVLYPEQYVTEQEMIAAARRLHARTPVDAVLALWEGAVEPAAAIAAALGLAGNSPEAVRASRDKGRAAECFARAGIPHPATVVFDVDDDPEVIEKRLPYPFVVKLPRSTNSHSVTLVRTREDLVTALALIERLYRPDRNDRLHRLYAPAGIGPARPVLAQEYVPGTEFNIDLLLTPVRHAVLGIFEKHPPALPTFGEVQSVYPPALTGTQRRSVEEVAVAAARALGATQGAAHVEVRVGNRGPVVIEVGLRPGGFLTPLAIERLTGLDPVTALTRLMISGELPPVPPTPAGRACLYGAVNVERAGRVVRIAGEDQVRRLPGVVRFEVLKRPGDRVVTLPEGTDYHIAAFLVEGATREGVESVARRLRELLVVELESEPT